MWVLAVVLGIILFLVILLAIPVDLIFHAEKDVNFRTQARLQWLFGLIGKDISFKRKKPESKEETKRKSIRPVLAMLRSRGFLKKLLAFIKAILRRLSIHDLRLGLRIGLDDPAETGMLFGMIGPAMLCTRHLPLMDIQIEPAFDREDITGYCKGDIRASPLQLAGHFILFALSPTTLRAIKAMMAARRSKK